MVDACESRVLFDATPTAALNPVPTVTTAAAFVDFTVTYTDDVGIDPNTLGVGPDLGAALSPPDLIVRGPGGFAAIASYIAPDTPPAVSTSLTATYRIPAPNGRFNAFATGTYSVSIRPNAVADGDGNVVPEADLGTFDADVPAVTGGALSTGLDTDLTVRAVTVQPNGKIVVVGDESYGRTGVVNDGEEPSLVYVHTRGVVRRYNADGSIDTTFGGGDGRVELQPDADTYARAVAVRSDGTIYIAGGTGVADLGGTQFLLTRLTSTGVVDTGFSTDGQTIINFDSNVTGQDFATGIAFQSTGRIILGGQTTTLPGATPVVAFGLVRLNADGSVDNTFGTAGNGMIVTSIANGATGGVGRMAVGPSDEIVAAGGDGGTGVAVARFSSDGDPDIAFGGGDGVFTVPGLMTPGTGSAGDPLVGLVQLSDGRILVAAAPATGTGVALARLKAADGSLDAGFGTGGVATASFGEADADGVLVLPGNKYLVVGTDKAAGNVATALAAFNADGTPATAFGASGRTLVDALASAVSPATVAAALDASGNVLVGRVTADGTSRLRLLAGDFTPPAATLTVVPDVTTAGGANLTLTVTYTDDTAVKAADLTNNANTTITVSGPGGTPVAAVLSGVDSTTDGVRIVATYTFAAPGGSFDMADNGAYTVAIAANQVRDSTGNFTAAGTLGTFQVNIPAPGAPTAALVPVADVTTAGGTSVNFTITYTDPDGTIDTTTIGTSDVTVSTAGGTPLQVTGVSVSGTGAGVAVTYTATPPGGAWDSADNGTYVISTVANQVMDATGLSVPAAALGSFVVNVAAPGGDPGTPVGDFGTVTGKNRSLTFTANGTKVTLSLKGGTGHATMQDGRLVLVLDNTTAKTAVTIKTKGGTGRVTLGDVTAAGSLRSFTATTADLAGAFTVSGDGGKLAFGTVTGSIQSTTGAIAGLDVRGPLAGTISTAAALNKLTVRGDLTATLNLAGGIASLEVRGNMAGVLTSGGTIGKALVTGSTSGRLTANAGMPKLDLRGPLSGTIAAGGRIGSLSVRGDVTGTVTAGDGFNSISVRGNVTGAKLLAGTRLGNDGQLGGTGAAADQFTVGTIGKVAVTGAVGGQSTIAAGLDPVNGVFLDGDDRVVNSVQSTIGSVSVKKGVTDPARFVAGKYGKVRVPGAVVPGTDPRFVVL